MLKRSRLLACATPVFAVAVATAGLTPVGASASQSAKPSRHVTTVSAHIAESCGSSCFETFAAAAISTCGACTTRGTAWTSTLPVTLSIPKDSQDFDSMDEAAWLTNLNDPTGEATETGYFAGWWP